jgi:hypothetical protein
MSILGRLGRSLTAGYDRSVFGRPVLTLVAVAVFVSALGAFAPRFRLDASSESLVMENDRALRVYREVRAKYESDDFLIVTFTPHDGLFRDEALERLAELRDALAAIGQIESVTSLLDVPILDGLDLSLTELPTDPAELHCAGENQAEDCKRALESPLYRNLLISPDGETTGLRVDLKGHGRFLELYDSRAMLRLKAGREGLNADERRQVADLDKRLAKRGAEAREQQAIAIAEVRAVLDGFRDIARIHLGGVPMIAVDSIGFIRADLVNFGGAVGAFIVLILFIAFRRPRWVVLPLLTCAATVLSMVGLLGLIGWPVTVVSSNFVSLLLILNLALVVHLVVRFRELHALHPDWRQAELVRATVHSKFVPCLYTVLTTMVAFGSLLVSGIRPVIDFGWMMVLGLGLAFVLSFTLFPAALILLEAGSPAERRNLSGAITGAIARVVTSWPRFTLSIAAVLAVVGVAGTMQLSIENRFIDYFKKSTEIAQGMRLIDEKLGGTTPLDVLIDAPPDAETEDESEDPEVLAFLQESGEEAGIASSSYWLNSHRLPEVQRVHEYLESLPGTGKVLSIATAMEMFGALEPRVMTDDFYLSVFYRRLPDSVIAALFAPYMSGDGKQIRFGVRIFESSPDLRRNQLLEDIRHHLAVEMGYGAERVQLSGMMVLYNNMLQGLFRSQILTLGVVFGAIMLMFLVLFRSWRHAALGILPNLLSAALVLGLMGWARIPLDLMTVTIAAITIGIGVDNTIHYIHRYREELEVDGDAWAAVSRCHGSIGRALYYTTVTIVLGFSVLALSAFIPTIYFGLLTGLAMTAALLANLSLLPVLLATAGATPGAARG